jgi:hypothetical protein
MKQLNKNFLLGIALICLVFPFVIVWVLSLAKNFESSGPDDWILAYQPQQTEIIKKVQAAGGWNALKSDCILYAKTHKSGMFNVDYYWNGGRVKDFTGELPASMNALNPNSVYCLNESHTSPVILIYFPQELGLEIRCGESTIPNSKFFKYREHQITNDIYIILTP